MTETRWRTLCAAADVPEGSGQRFEIDGLPPIAVFHVQGAFHVTDDTCTHGDASLVEGWLEDDEVTCPFHAGKFCVRTGEPTMYPAEVALRVYPCRVTDGMIEVSPT